MVFQEAISEPSGKARKLQHDTWCLITNTQANRVAIVSSIIIKIFNSCKHWTVTIQPAVFMFSETVSNCIRCQFSVTVHQLFDFHSFLLCFCSILFVKFISIWLFVYSVYFLSWYWNCIPGISIPIITTIRQVNKHHTSDSAIFCLNIGSESLLPS
jgi:hypothetical protein